MSDATARDLDAALEHQKQVDETLRRAKEACLASIADGLEAHVMKIAKEVAYANTEITRELGREGVGRLRAELSEASQAVAGDLRAAVEQVRWPSQVQHSNYNTITASDVSSAIFKYLYGSRTNSIAAVFKTHGYPVEDDGGRRQQGLVLPQSLFDEDQLKGVTTAQVAADRARWDVEKAKAADDAAAVDDIWND